MEMRETEGARGFYSAKGTWRPRPGSQAPLAVYIWVLSPWARAPGPPSASDLNVIFFYIWVLAPWAGAPHGAFALGARLPGAPALNARGYFCKKKDIIFVKNK